MMPVFLCTCQLTYIVFEVCMSVLFFFPSKFLVIFQPVHTIAITYACFSQPAELTMLPTPLSLAGSAAPPVCSIFHQVISNTNTFIIIRNTPWQVPLWSVMAAEFLSLCAFVARMAWKSGVCQVVYLPPPISSDCFFSPSPLVPPFFFFLFLLSFIFLSGCVLSYFFLPLPLFLCLLCLPTHYKYATLISKFCITLWVLQCMFMVTGGFVEAGDSVCRTLMKEFEEEALNSLEMTQVCVM